MIIGSSMPPPTPQPGKPNQCPECGAFRVDGRAPTVHFGRCGRGPSGIQLPPLRDAARPVRRNRS